MPQAVRRYNPEGVRIGQRRSRYPRAVWLNPTPEAYWERTVSTRILRRLMGDRMFPLTLAGIDAAMQALS